MIQQINRSIYLCTTFSGTILTSMVYVVLNSKAVNPTLSMKKIELLNFKFLMFYQFTSDVGTNQLTQQAFSRRRMNVMHVASYSRTRERFKSDTTHVGTTVNMTIVVRRP
jgi:hypothetical protein